MVSTLYFRGVALDRPFIVYATIISLYIYIPFEEIPNSYGIGTIKTRDNRCPRKHYISGFALCAENGQMQ